RAPSADDLARLRRDLHRRFAVRSGDGPLRPRDAVGMRNLVAHQIVADRDKVAAGAAQLSKLPKGASPSEGFKWEYVIHPWFRESVQDIGPPGGTRHWEEDGWLDASAVHHFKALSGGALYLVTRDMQALIGHASATLPNFTISLTDVPSTTGYCLLALPSKLAGTVDVQAFSWSIAPDPAGTPVVLVGVWNVPQGAPGPIGLRWHYGFADGDAVHDPDDPQSTEAWRDLAWLVTFWRMVGEEWVSIDRTTPKASRGTSGQRGSAAPSEVRIVTLRRAKGHEGDPDVAGVSVDYSHRWWVRGHWRNQWYPSQERHAPRWIRGHVKGPEDKPFITKETVNVLRR